MAINPTSSLIPYNQFDKAQTLTVAGSDFQVGKYHFNFDYVQGGYTRQTVTQSDAASVDYAHSAVFLLLLSWPVLVLAYGLECSPRRIIHRLSAIERACARVSVRPFARGHISAMVCVHFHVCAHTSI